MPRGDFDRWLYSEKVYVGNSDMAPGARGCFNRFPVKKGELLERAIMVPLNGPDDLGHYNEHLFTWSDDRKLWAIASGTVMFYNHSDKENANILKKGDLKNNMMDIIALKDIPPHTELVSAYFSKEWRDCFQKF